MVRSLFVRLSPYSNNSSETAGPISIKFIYSLPAMGEVEGRGVGGGEGLIKYCLNGPCHLDRDGRHVHIW